MKKILLLLTTVCFVLGAKSAPLTDTLARTVHYPSYFYAWWDDYTFTDTVWPDNTDWERFVTFQLPLLNFNNNNCSEMAQKQYTSQGINVIGLAVSAPVDILPSCMVADTTIAGATEYLRLYKPGSGNTMTLIDEALFNPFINDTSFIYEIDRKNCLEYYPVQEAYFEKDDYVTDSFYVAITTSGVPPNEAGLYPHYPVEPVALVDNWDTIETASTYHLYPLFRHKYRSPASGANWIQWNRRVYYFIWPILAQDSVSDCQKVDGLSGSMDSATLTVSWTGLQSHSRWEVSVGLDPVNPDAGTIYPDTLNYIQLHFADTGTYYIRVRGYCEADSSWGDWSDSLVYYVSSGDITGIQSPSLLDQFTSVYPNPAVGTVTVTSSYHITSLDLYDLSGRKVTPDSPTQGKPSLMAALSLKGLSAGTYILLVHTEQGTVAKRLVVAE